MTARDPDELLQAALAGDRAALDQLIEQPGARAGTHLIARQLRRLSLGRDRQRECPGDAMLSDGVSAGAA